MQWYEEVRRLKQLPVAAAAGRPKVVFYGSSTFTRWLGLVPAFPPVEAVNLGFGGSALAACAWFLERVVPRQRPNALLVYAGDNDLGDGRTPEEVVLFFEQLLAGGRARLGAIPLGFISVKPSPARRYLRANIGRAQGLIRQRIAALGPPYYFLDLYPAPEASPRAARRPPAPSPQALCALRPHAAQELLLSVRSLYNKKGFQQLLKALFAWGSCLAALGAWAAYFTSVTSTSKRSTALAGMVVPEPLGP